MQSNEECMKFRFKITQYEENQQKLTRLQEELLLFTDVKNLLMDFSEHTRDIIKYKLESLVNSALKCIFKDKEIKFKIIVNKTKKIIFYDLYVETDGTITLLYDAKGGGVLDVVTTALRISFVRMFSGNLRQTIIFDEPFKNLDSERLTDAMEWLAEISKDFDMQFLIVTHEESIIDKSEKVFVFKLNNGVTQVEEQTTNSKRDIRKAQDPEIV